MFRQITVVYHLFQLHRGNTSRFDEPSEKVWYLTLDLRKNFLLWTLRKKTTMNECLKVRFWTESLTYWKFFLKEHKYPYKWSAIEHNCINTGTSENFIWSNNSFAMWSMWSKDWKTSYVIKAGPTEKFLQNKRNPCISEPELKIKNQIIIYRWTFWKDSLKSEKVLWVIHN